MPTLIDIALAAAIVAASFLVAALFIMTDGKP